MPFENRIEGGEKLVSPLQKYKQQSDTVVIGLPRGGVVTAYEIAKGLHLPLDVIFPKKVGAPSNPELAIGAVTETGNGAFNRSLIDRLGITDEFLQQAKAQSQQAAQQRLEVYRKIAPKISLEKKTVIVADDGLATGATMKAALQAIRAEGAAWIVVAVPVSPVDTGEEMREWADEVIILEMPSVFYAVGQFYRDFTAVEDEEVLEILKKAH